MTGFAFFRPGGRGRGAPRGLALAALTIAALTPTGCASFGGGCDPCGEGLGSRLRGCSLFSGAGFGQKLFHHKSSACEPGCVGDTCGSPISGGTTVVPIPGPGPVMGTPVEEPLDLSPAGIPTGPATSPPPAGPTGSAPKVGSQARSSNRVYRPRTDRALANQTPAPRTITPEPASGPAAGASATPAPAPTSTAEDILANLPPIRPAIDRSEPPKAPPPAAEADSIPKPAPATASKPVDAAPTPAPAPTSEPKGPSEAPPKAEGAVYSGGPGIKPFQAVSPLLSCGGVPTAQGWEWLARDLGYKTVLDLRDVKEDRQAANAAASANGLRYVSLPVSAEKLDATVVKQFLEEIETASAKPLYFFDVDGKRAATLWYIKLVSVDKLSSQAALKQARDIGTPDLDLVFAASRYLSSLNASAPASTPTPASEPPAPKAPATTSAPEAAPTNDPGAQIPSAATSASIEPATESLTWKPYAALVMAGLGLPLAFFGRSALRDHQHRASLPGPGRSPRSLPPASDA